MEKMYRHGQVGLMLLVVMGIVISLVLSVASRSLSDISLSRQERENSSTFSLAESGVEQALSSLAEGSYEISDVSTGQITGNYTIARTNSFDMYVKEGETAQIDLSGSPSNISVSWVKTGENPGTCTEGSGTAPAAIEVVLINAANQATRSYYNASGCNLTGVNGFANASAGTGGFGSAQAIVAGANVLMRIKPIYNGTTVNVTGTNLTSQLYLIQSEASGGDARTDIEVKRTLDAAGSIFDYALFSGTTIIK